MTKASIAIVGAGRMGIGIATAVLMANRGHKVTLVDTKKREGGEKTRILDSALNDVRANLELLDSLGVLSGGAETLMEDIGTLPDLGEEISGCSLIFEALPEKVSIKQAFCQSLNPFLGNETVIASATSTFHLDVFWEVCAKPGNVVSAHWLNPAFLIPLVEVAYGEKTQKQSLVRIHDFLQDIGKIPVKMRSSPGFVVPRIQAAAMNEAIRILQEGVATAEEIDTAIKAGFGFRLGVMGLIEFVDLGGVDILIQAGRYLHEKLGGQQFQPPELVIEKVDRSEVGPKTGKGFYDYEGIDSRALFNEKYKGFVELLHLYRQSKHLTFSGGIGKQKPPENDAITTKQKELS